MSDSRHRRPLLPGILTGVSLIMIAMTPAAAQLAEVALRTDAFAQGFSSPLFLTHAGDDSGRVFVVEQGGVVRIVDADGSPRATPFLDISNLTRGGGEQGLLGLAFHPRFATNGEVYASYTRLNGNSVVSRLRLSSDPDVVDLSSLEVLLTVGQPFTNHNGGHLAFGPDGFLYLGLGDGGAGGDPNNNGQRPNTLLGTLLRLDIDRAATGLAYAIPADNPFVGNSQGRDEVWAFGLRNPWRFSFDRQTGDLFIGDVGQNAREEIDFQPASSSGGENYGWRLMEGGECFQPSTGCEDPSLVRPVIDYGRDEGLSVTGGYRYRGSAQPALAGVYLFGDFGSGRIWGATPRADGSWQRRLLLQSGLSISSFGEDQAGELYVIDYFAGTILRLLAAGADCPVELGHPRFCQLCGPCVDGEGDCDNDGECAAGTRCVQNIGAQFGFTAATDVCRADNSGGCPWPLGDPRYCRDCGPCADGEGDCDGNVQCVAGLGCSQNVGADFGFAANIDVCTAPDSSCPWPLGHGRLCTDCGPCAAGQGDCDSDQECVPGLTCAQNVGADFGFPPAVDVCVQ